LKYYEVSLLVLRRTAYQSKSRWVRSTPEIRLTDSNEKKCVETPEGGKYGLRKFADMDNQYFGKEILNKQGLTKEEIENIQLFYPRCFKSI